MKIRIDRDRCCGAGQCVMAAPSVFDQDDDSGMVVVAVEDPEPARHAEVREAAELCPTQTISVDG